MSYTCKCWKENTQYRSFGIGHSTVRRGDDVAMVTQAED